LRKYVKKHRLGEVRLGPARARISERARFEPDLFVVSAVDECLPRADEPITPFILVRGGARRGIVAAFADVSGADH